MRFDSLQETLTRAGFSVHTFPTGQAAKDWPPSGPARPSAWGAA